MILPYTLYYHTLYKIHDVVKTSIFMTFYDKLTNSYEQVQFKTILKLLDFTNIKKNREFFKIF